MTQVIIVRHGETEWNRNEIFRGRIDVGLNDTGVRQADLLGIYLKDCKIEAVYSSPLKRALDTAQHIAAHHGLDVAKTEDLIDIDFGIWQGLKLEEVRKKYPGLFRQWEKEPHLVSIPGGENLVVVRERVLTLLNDLISKHAGTVVLVSHRAVNKVLICQMLGLDNSHFWAIKQDNGGVTVFDYTDNYFVLTRHNDVCHLSPLKKQGLRDF